MLAARCDLLGLLSVVLGGLVVQVGAQLTDAKCSAAFDWATNSKGQSPCLVGAYLDSACNPDPTDAYIQALGPTDHYSLPTSAANPCYCNTVFYSVIAACAYCQGSENSPWSTWKYNCTSSYIEEFPAQIPAGTAVPSWAYQDVVTTDNFNVTTAQAFAAQNHPDSTSPAAPSSTPATSSSSSSVNTASLTSFSSASSTPSAPPVNDSSSGTSQSNIGPIVGGVVGGVAGIVIVAGLIYWLMRRRNASQRPPSAEFAPHTRSPPLPLETTPWSLEAYEKAPVTATPPPPEPLSPKLYNPDDPSTFPTSPAMSDTVTSTTRNSAYDRNSQLQPNAFQPSRYNGTAEI